MLTYSFAEIRSLMSFQKPPTNLQSKKKKMYERIRLFKRKELNALSIMPQPVNCAFVTRDCKLDASEFMAPACGKISTQVHETNAIPI